MYILCISTWFRSAGGQFSVSILLALTDEIVQSKHRIFVMLQLLSDVSVASEQIFLKQALAELTILV